MLEHAVKVSVGERFEFKTAEGSEKALKFWKYSSLEVTKLRANSIKEKKQAGLQYINLYVPFWSKRLINFTFHAVSELKRF